jgi:hypothetical protein
MTLHVSLERIDTLRRRSMRVAARGPDAKRFAPPAML